MCIAGLSSFAQTEEEIIGFDFTYVGKGATGDNSEISIQRYDFRALLPQALKKKDHYLMHSFNYATSNIHYGNTIARNAKVNSFHTLSYNLSLYKPIKNDWYLYAGVGPYVSSNFDSGLTGKELQFSGMIMFTKQIGNRKDLEFTCGIFYHPSMGPETPLPLVGLSWTPNEHWNINCGFPEFSINYNFSKNTTLGTNLFIAGDEYTLSKSERIYRTFEKHFNDGDILIDTDASEEKKYKKINRLSYTDYGVGLHFKQRLFSNFFLKVNSGYTFYRKLEFKRNSKSVFDTKSKDKMFIRAGISFMM
jgi:hypothetical protein